MSFRGSNVLITGGCGFIGSNLARKMLFLGATVSIVDVFDPDTGANEFNLSEIVDAVKIYRSDMQDAAFVNKLIQGQDYVFNLMGQSNHIKSMSNPFADLSSNIQAQLTLLEACRNYNPEIRIVFSSTRQIYGCPDYLPVDEKHPVRPVDINGIHKLTAEQYHTLYGKIYGIPVAILRLTNTYGPGMRIKDANQNFLGVWIRRILEDEPFEVWGGEQLRDFIYIDDCIEAFLLAANNEAAIGATYNVGGIEPINLKSLSEMLVSVWGKGKYVIRSFPEERKKIDVGSFDLDDRFIRSQLNWQPKISLRVGLKKTLDYFANNIDHYV